MPLWKSFKSRQSSAASVSSEAGLSNTVDFANFRFPSSEQRQQHHHPSPLPDRRRSSGFVVEATKARELAATQRRGSEYSEISNYHSQLDPLSQSPSHQRQRSIDRHSDPLGVTVLHEAEAESRSVDIFFVHGLGGTSLRTWCKHRDLNYLWPKLWLPNETGLETARILTFGYNAHFSSRKENTASKINDFAADLLYSMKFKVDGVGEVPIVIVAHSMGGLVFKQAFISGLRDDKYSGIMSKIKSVLFLATPHRGTDLAGYLNRVLSSSIFGHSPKEYVQELGRNSTTIDGLNEAFRHHADELHIFSFYETIKTSLGPLGTVMILEKDSSVLGYRNETQQGLAADHHGVCKFSDMDDPNYKSVKGALSSVVRLLRFSRSAAGRNDGDGGKELRVLQQWLGVGAPPEDDLLELQQNRAPGTCEGMLSRSEFQDCVASNGPRLLWVHAPPASGKTMQASLVIDHLRSTSGTPVIYWFFKAGDAYKRSVANMLRSLAYQIASHDAGFRRMLVERAKLGMNIDKADAFAVWREVFASRLASLRDDMYWVIDGVDEAESIRTFVDLVANIGTSPSCGAKVVVFGRPLSLIIQAVQRARRKVSTTEMTLVDNLGDIQRLAADELEGLGSSQEFKDDIVSEIAARSQGNFLWASRVLEKILRCYRPEDIKRVLRSTPDGMDKLYHRMAADIASLELERDKALCRILLSWAMYARRPVSVEELMLPYAEHLETLMEVRPAISQICGQFVSINTSDQVVLIHQTAREYLKTSTRLPFTLDVLQVNEELLAQSLASLSDPTLRAKVRQGKTPRFLEYASTSWPFHLDRAGADSDGVLEALVGFFAGDYPLAWIQLLAIAGQLSVLVAGSAALAQFVRKHRQLDAIKPATLQRLPELQLLEAWALDLLKMTAKFGSRLAEDPESIYKCLPALSPENSVLRQRFAHKLASPLCVSGFSQADWDDCLARVSLHNGGSARQAASHVAVSALHLAVADDSPDGTIQVWNNVIFREHLVVKPGEPICAIAFSQSGDLLSCFGLDNTYVWRVQDGAQVMKVPGPYRERALSLVFSLDETELLVATDLRRVHKLGLEVADSKGWAALPSSLMEEKSLPEGSFINSPSSLAFSPDKTQLAVAYKGFPLAIWSLDPPEMIARNKRKQKQGPTTSTTWTGVNRVVWHPYSGQVLGIYRDGNIFRWDPVSDGHEEVKQELDATPSDIQCSGSGHVFATSDVKGAVKIYDCAQMVLIYKLTSHDIITAIAFSPDSRRFYDLRGTYCNVSEPNCLIRLVDLVATEESEDSDSVSGSERERKGSILSEVDDVHSTSRFSLTASEAHAESQPALTCVATSARNERVFAYAREDGTVCVCDADHAERAHVVAEPMFPLGIAHLAISDRGDKVAFANLHGRVTVKSIRWSAQTGHLRSETCFAETRPAGRGAIMQLLLHGEADRLFISSAEKIQVLDIVDGGKIIAEKLVTPDGPDARWENHPTDADKLLAFSAEAVTAYTWAELEPAASWPLALSHTSADLGQPGTLRIEALLPSYRADISLAIVSFQDGGGRFLSYLLLDMSPVSQYCGAASKETRKSIEPINLPPSVAQNVMQPVGLLTDGTLVFLDDHLYVCSARVVSSTSNAGSERQFFIPRDWLTTSAQMLCRLQPDGKFLCPRTGEVIVMKSDVGMDWVGWQSGPGSCARR